MKKKDFIIYCRSRKVRLETLIAKLSKRFSHISQKRRVLLKVNLYNVNVQLLGKKSGLVS